VAHGPKVEAEKEAAMTSSLRKQQPEDRPKKDSSDHLPDILGHLASGLM
jgi:hypothetical protein